MARDYGKGSIKPALNKDGQQRKNREGKLVWKIRICLGVDQTTQNAVTKQETFSGSLTEAKKRAAALQVKFQDLRPEMVAQTFSGFIPVWTSSLHIGGKASDETIEGYARKLSHMEKYLGSKKLSSITAKDIEAALVGMEKEGLSGTTRHQVFGRTKALFAFAVGRGYIVRDPCALVPSPRINDPKRRSLTPEEVLKLIAKLDEAEAANQATFENKESRQNDHGNLFGRSRLFGVNERSCIEATRLALATGMRRGELCALRWGSVDLKAGKIEVVQSISEQLKVKKPKTKAGFRTISIDQETVSHLAKWKAQQASILRLIMQESDGVLFGLDQDQETPVFISGAGGYLDPSRFESWWGKFRTSAGFEGLKLHELRHTQASLLLANNVDISTVQTRLGHATASTTLNFYAHALPGGDEAAASLLGGLFAAKPNQPGIIDASAAFKSA